ncbi:hypothetical protein NMG60_11005928 [Bertholletia excelsa]
MFHDFGHSPAEVESLKKSDPVENKPSSNSVLTHLSPSYRTFLFLLILFQLLLLGCITRASQKSVLVPRDSQDFGTGECDSRRIYVYDLPAEFNKQLVNNCNNLDPWHSKCDANLNSGFGPQATELAGIVPESILPAWYWTDHYWGEVIFHNRMLNYKCRTLEPESANAFYIPFYVGLAIGNHLWGNHSARERDWLSERLLKWVQEQPGWKRSNGSDHIVVLGRLTWDFRRRIDAENDWGTSFLHMPAMKNVIRLSVERNIWDFLEVAVPYPTVFHPRFDSDVVEWQRFVRSRNRTALFALVGGARESVKNDFRGLLQTQCQNNPDVCRHVDCARKNCLDGTTAIMEAFLDSDFCLQPRGDGFTRRSVFDCMMAGSIPVFFWKRTAYLQYEWFVPAEPGSYSVFIHRGAVRNGKSIRKVLESYSREEVARMREKVIEYIPRFVYAKPSQGLAKTKDAFDIAIEGIFSKFKNHMERGRLGDRNPMN